MDPLSDWLVEAPVDAIADLSPDLEFRGYGYSLEFRVE